MDSPDQDKVVSRTHHEEATVTGHPENVVAGKSQTKKTLRRESSDRRATGSLSEVVRKAENKREKRRGKRKADQRLRLSAVRA